jgi:mannobiose 2-epimerase
MPNPGRDAVVRHERSNYPLRAVHKVWRMSGLKMGESLFLAPPYITSYGHNIELAWLLRRATTVLNLETGRYEPALRKLVDHTLRYGVDQQYGGVYHEGLHAGRPTNRKKNYWTQAEALVGFLDAYAAYGDACYWRAFESTWAFVEQHMIVPSVGEWYESTRQDGTPLNPNTGGMAKAAYHSGRALVECVDRLARLIRKMSAQSPQ